jgi:hypothetical protein
VSTTIFVPGTLVEGADVEAARRAGFPLEPWFNGGRETVSGTPRTWRITGPAEPAPPDPHAWLRGEALPPGVVAHPPPAALTEVQKARAWLTSSHPGDILERARLVRHLAHSVSRQRGYLSAVLREVWGGEWEPTPETGEALVAQAQAILGSEWEPKAPGRLRVVTELTVDHYVLDTVKEEITVGPTSWEKASAMVARG